MDEWVDGVLQNAQSKQARALAWLRPASSALSVGRVVSSGHHQHHQHHHQHHCTWLLCQRVITIIASASSPASPSPPSSSRASFAQTLVASAVRLLLIFFRYGPSWARGRGVQRGGVLRTSRLDRAAPWGLRSAKLSAKLSPSVPRCPCAPITVLGHAPLPLCPPLHPSVALWARDVTLVSFGHFGHHGSEVHGARNLLRG